MISLRRDHSDYLPWAPKNPAKPLYPSGLSTCWGASTAISHPEICEIQLHYWLRKTPFDFRLPPRSSWDLRSSWLLPASSGNFLPTFREPYFVPKRR